MSQTKIEALNLDDFVSSTCNDVQRSSRSGGFSVIKSDNGNRCILSKEQVLSHLSHHNFVQIAYSDNYLAIANYISDSNTNYKLSKSGKNGVIYNTALVKEIARQFDLDYSERTSMTFPIYDVQETENGTVVYVDMNPDVTEE